MISNRPRPQPSRRPPPSPPKKKGTPSLYYAIAGGALLLLIGGIAMYMSSLSKTKERLVRDADRLVAEDRKLRASTPPPESPKPPPPPPAPATPAPPPPRKRVEGKLPLSLDYHNEPNKFRLRIMGGYLVQPHEDPDFLRLADYQGKMFITARMVTPPSTIAQGWNRYLSLLKSEYPSTFPGFMLGDTRTETSGGLPALYVPFTCKNGAGQLIGAAQYFVAAKDRMAVVSFNAPTLFDRELQSVVDDTCRSVRLDGP